MLKIPKIPNIPKGQITPVITDLLEIIHLQNEKIQQLKDEIARLKKRKPKPDIKPSKLEKDSSEKEAETEGKDGKKKRPGSKKRKKTQELIIHETKLIPPDNVPEGSRFKGYADYVVQDIIITPHNIKYRLENWLTPDGNYVTGKLPPDHPNGHFGPSLICFVLYQYHHALVTQPLILEELREFGIDISSGQLNRIITEDKDIFHKEKKDILLSGLGVSKYINVDDTGARHNGKNGYCTHIGNEFFAWFESTESKSRINFLELLSAGKIRYTINEDALHYMEEQKLPKFQYAKISKFINTAFDSKKNWELFLDRLNIKKERHVRIATEGALVANIIENGFNKDMVIMSDDAGQFKVFLFLHTLCWVHAERAVNKLVGFNKDQRLALEEKRSDIWKFYADLKEYKLSPNEEKKKLIEDRFDEIFMEKTCFASLNQALQRLYKNKAELLLVLDYPEIPLHNNLSENDIREYVKRRKISGSTRNEVGRRCRDTFTSLKKTCRKLEISFWKFLRDRIMGRKEIPYLPELIISKFQRAGP